MTTKINISLSKETLETIEKTAKDLHTTRSAFIREAALAYIEQLKREEAEKKLLRQRLRAAETQDQIRETFEAYNAVKELRKWRDKRK